MRIIAFVTLFFICIASFGQGIDELQRQRTAAEAEIARIATELKGVNSSQKSAAQKLTLLKKRITERAKVVANIDAQITILIKKESAQGGVIATQNDRLNELKIHYRNSILKLFNTYCAGGFKSLLASSSTRRQWVRRSYFTEVFLNHIQSQARAVNAAQVVVGAQMDSIINQKQQLLDLRRASDQEIKLIAAEKAEVESLSASLKKNERSLLDRQRQYRAAVDALQAEIKKIVNAEIATSSTGKFKNAPLSGEFASAKGRLISPMQGAKIVDNYGIHNHPTEKGVKIDNKGVNLQGSASGVVRSVFEGEVRRVFVVAGMGRSVLVRHGEFLTVYSSLENVTVSAGQKISGGMKIGNTEDDGILHFEIWKENTTLNPSSWVKF